jgi:hypothetical protein
MLYIKDETTARLVSELARRRGLTKERFLPDAFTSDLRT